MNQQFYMEGNLYFLVRVQLDICQCLDQCIRIDQMIKNEQYFYQNPDVDVQKYYNDIRYTLETQKLILEHIQKEPSNSIALLCYEEEYQKFQKSANELCNYYKEYFEMMKYRFQLFLGLLKRLQKSFVKFVTKEAIVINYFPEVLQKEYQFKDQLLLEIIRQYKNDVQGENQLLKQNHIPFLVQQFQPMRYYLFNNFFDEKDQYQLLHIKIKFLINFYRIINGFRITQQHNELFCFTTSWDELNLKVRIYENYFWGHLNRKFEYCKKVSTFIFKTGQNGLKNQITKFFSNKEIRKSMKKVQLQLKIDEDLSLSFINQIKIVSNPDGCILCETIKDFAIIINIHSLIYKYEGKFDDKEFQNLFITYAIVLTIQGWTQLQILKNSKLLHKVYEKKLNQYDEQYMLNHLIFGTSDDKSNLRFLDQDIIEQILNFTTLFKCQQYLQQTLDQPSTKIKLYEFQQ